MRPKIIFNIYGATGGNYAGNLYDTEYIAPALRTMCGGNQQPLIMVTMLEYDSIYYYQSKDYVRPPMHNISRCIKTDSHPVAVIIKQEINMGQNTKPGNTLPAELQGKKFRIRKLTPRECFRLMGVDDKDIDKIQAFPYESLIEHPAYSKAERFTGMTEKEKRSAMKRSISDSAQYKLAGNSIVVDVLYHLFRKMFIETGRDCTDEEIQLELF